MKRNQKLNELRSLASKTVANETKKANNILNEKSKPSPNVNKQPVPVVKTTPVTVNLPDKKSDVVQEPPKRLSKQPEIRKIHSLGTKRLQTVIRDKDLSAIQQAKVFLLENGVETVSSNGIVQAALRALTKDRNFIQTYLSVAAEDPRRKTVSN